MKKSAVTATLICVLLCCVLLLALLFLAPYLAGWYVELRAMPQSLETVILIAFYICVLPAGTALACIYLLLQNIRREQLFCNRNCKLMSVISWCCIAVALVTSVAGLWYAPFFFIASAMLFIFLIVRVVRLCFVAAAALKEENSLTI